MDTMTSSDETYNGYANRETWAFNLHWQNDEGFYNLVLDYARQVMEEDGPALTSQNALSDYTLGHSVVTYVENELPELAPNLWELMRTDVGSFWRIDVEEVGAAVRESLDIESGD